MSNEMNTLKSTLLILFLLFSIETAYSSSYRVPKKPASITVADVNLDGYSDIVLGHDPNSENGWAGLTILMNNGYGYFTIVDTIFLFAGQSSVHVKNIDFNPYPEIFAKFYSYQLNNEFIAVIKNMNRDSIALFPVNTIEGINSFEIEDVGIDSSRDIVLISHLGKFLGIMYGNTSSGFSEPIKIHLGFHPSGLAVGKINDDDRNDIAVSGNGNVIKIYLNKPNGLDTVNINSSPYFITDITIADINNDNKNEIIGIDWGIPGTRKRIMVYSQDTSGIFQLSYSKWIDEAMAEIFVADLNNDSFIDITYNVSFSYPNSNYELFHTYILFNNKNGTFQDPVNYYTGICSHVSYAEDLDGNGWKDIITLNYDFYNPPPDTCSIHILFNDGTGVFQEDPVTDVKDEKPIPAAFELYQNYPNPFNPSTAISYKLPFESDISITIFDLTGRVTKTMKLSNQAAGNKTAMWDGKNDFGEPLSSGVYICTFKALSLESNGKSFTKSLKLMLLK